MVNNEGGIEFDNFMNSHNDLYDYADSVCYELYNYNLQELANGLTHNEIDYEPAIILWNFENFQDNLDPIVLAGTEINSYLIDETDYLNLETEDNDDLLPGWAVISQNTEEIIVNEEFANEIDNPLFIVVNKTDYTGPAQSSAASSAGCEYYDVSRNYEFSKLQIKAGYRFDKSKKSEIRVKYSFHCADNGVVYGDNEFIRLDYNLINIAKEDIDNSVVFYTQDLTNSELFNSMNYAKNYLLIYYHQVVFTFFEEDWWPKHFANKNRLVYPRCWCNIPHNFYSTFWDEQYYNIGVDDQSTDLYTEFPNNYDTRNYSNNRSMIEIKRND